MRPLELELTAFRSYDRATIDLRPYERVVITGDTGAGKTSLLDAVCFALFGRTPEQTRPRELLTLGHSHGEVRLTFSARGEVWRATRRYGRDAPEPAHLLERLVTDGGPSRETLSGEAAVERRLSAVVGMSFAAFTSAVLLTQGRFAQFLSSQPRDRDAILRELFGVASLEGARQAALVHAAAAQRQADLRAEDAARLPPHATGARIAAARAARDAAARRGAARALRPVAERLARRRAEADEARAAAAAARAAAGALPGHALAEELLARLRTARREAARADRARARAASRAAAKAAARDGLRERHGGGAAELATLGERAARAEELARGLPARRIAMAEREAALAERRAELDELSRALSRALAEHERLMTRAALVSARALRRDEAAAAAEARARAEAEARAAAGRCEVAAHALVAAEREHDRAHRHDLAATLRAGLAPGDPCPVCGGEVGDGRVAPAGDGDAAREGLRRARTRAEETARTHAAAQERARAAAADAEGAVTALARAQAALEEAGIAGAAEEAPGGEAERTRARQAAIAAARAGLADGERDLASRRARLAAERERVEEDAAEVERARQGLGAWAAHAVPADALAAAVAEVRAAEAAADAAGAAATDTADAVARMHAEVAALEGGPVAALRAATARAAARARLEAPADDLPAEDLIAAAAALRERALAAAGTHDDEAVDAERGAREEAARLAVLGAGLGVAAPEDVGPALRRCERARDECHDRLGALDRAAAGARRLRAEAEAARAEARVHQQVAADLRANAFPRFLLARYRERLAVGASTRLQELTAGAYRFCGTEPDPMAVVDLRRGERLRPSRACPAASASWPASPWPWGSPTWRPSRAGGSTACSWTRGSRRSTPSRSSRRWRASSGLPGTVAWWASSPTFPAWPSGWAPRSTCARTRGERATSRTLRTRTRGRSRPATPVCSPRDPRLPLGQPDPRRPGGRGGLRAGVPDRHVCLQRAAGHRRAQPPQGPRRHRPHRRGAGLPDRDRRLLAPVGRDRPELRARRDRNDPAQPRERRRELGGGPARGLRPGGAAPGRS